MTPLFPCLLLTSEHLFHKLVFSKDICFIKIKVMKLFMFLCITFILEANFLILLHKFKEQTTEAAKQSTTS